MEYTKEVKEYVTSKFNKVLELFGYKKDYILHKLSLCNKEEEFLMKYLYASMPLSDISNYDFELFYEYVKHGIFLRENTPWGHKIPEDIFLNYVLHYRVNNEAIEDCRKEFYKMVYPRLENKNMYEAVLEINYWCAENATYKSTDERTVSPLTVLKCGYGRCGEESTFAVTALRSAGIPARQIYTPRWAHCDDNHAWVEVWCDGKWHYLGACEPEPVLDKGWFTSAASRAMVIHSRVFSQYLKHEDIILQNEVLTTINNIKKYAHTKLVHIKAINSQNEPIKDVEIRLEILNYSELVPIAKLVTDSNGQASISLGLGTLAIHVVKQDKFLYKIVNIKDVDEILFNMDEAMCCEGDVTGQSVNGQDVYEENYHGKDINILNMNRQTINVQDIRSENVNVKDIDVVPPKDRVISTYSITEEEKADHKKRFNHCNTVREHRINSIVKDIEYNTTKWLQHKEEKNVLSELAQHKKDKLEKTEQRAEKILVNENEVFAQYYDEVKDILLNAKGNYEEILSFLNNSDNNEDLKTRVNLLKSLSKKDYVDSRSTILSSHINQMVSFNGNYEEEIYNKYVLCSRIYLEKITDFREFIINHFSSEVKENFIKYPADIWNYINENIKEFPKRDYEELYTVPLETLKMGMGSLMSKKILFVAICRSLGTPARINTNDQSIEYYKYNSVHASDMDKSENFLNHKICNNEEILNKAKDIDENSLNEKYENLQNQDENAKLYGEFVKVEDKYILENSILTVNNTSDSELKYYQNWTIAVLEKGVYKTISLQENIPSQGKFNISVTPGYYRILTSNRLPNGSIFVKKYVFLVKVNENKSIDITIRDAKISDMLENYELQDFTLKDKCNNAVHASQLMNKEKSIIIWVEEGKEPTEHILNEMIELYQEFNSIKGKIIFVLRDVSALENKTLQKVYGLIPNIKTYFDDFSDNVSTIARRMYLDPDKLPLILIANSWDHPWGGNNYWKYINGIYACSGYNVGLGELIIKIVK